MPRRPSWLVLVAMVGCGAPEPDGLTLSPYDVGGALVWVPDGWTVEVDAANGIVSMEEDPSRDDTAGVLVLTGAAGGAGPDLVHDVFIDLLLDSGFSGLAVVQEAAAPGAIAVEHAGAYESVDARVGVLSLVDAGLDRYLLTAFAASSDEYVAYGGMDLVIAVLAGPPGAAAPAPADAGWTSDASGAVGPGFDQMWDEMYGTWSNNLGDDGWCWGDDGGCL